MGQCRDSDGNKDRISVADIRVRVLVVVVIDGYLFTPFLVSSDSSFFPWCVVSFAILVAA